MKKAKISKKLCDTETKLSLQIETYVRNELIHLFKKKMEQQESLRLLIKELDPMMFVQDIFGGNLKRARIKKMIKVVRSTIKEIEPPLEENVKAEEERQTKDSAYSFRITFNQFGVRAQLRNPTTHKSKGSFYLSQFATFYRASAS